MKQGTISVLFGCHSFMHTHYVLKAWHYLYGKRPAFWQYVCIIVHDWGHWGKQYLDNYEEKKLHWVAGARIARFLFGEKGYNFNAGHCDYSGVAKSDLYKADKVCYAFVPVWWGWLAGQIEPKLHGAERKAGIKLKDAVKTFLNDNRKRLEAGVFESNQQYYMNRRAKYENLTREK